MKNKKGLNYTDDELGELANMLISACVRNNTSLEDYHSEWKEFDDEKMKKLMIECCDNLYLALRQLCRTDEDEVRDKLLSKTKIKME